ncbi:MAG: hypothetical protein ACFFFG_08320 [Candidatus Thorarchaeota archaeon]
MGSNHTDGVIAPSPQFAGLVAPPDDYDTRRGHPDRQRIWINGTRAGISEWACYGPNFRRLARLHNRIRGQETEYAANSRMASYLKTVNRLSEFFSYPMMVECAISLSRVPDLFYSSERNRYVGIIAMIELQRSLHDAILTDSELERINDSLQFSEMITRIDLNRERRKILWKSPTLRKQWKEIRTRTHDQALQHAVHQSFEQDLNLNVLSRTQVKRIWRVIVSVTKRFLKTDEGRRINAYQSWARAIVYHTLKEFSNLDIKSIFCVTKLNVICTTRTRLNKALNRFKSETGSLELTVPKPPESAISTRAKIRKIPQEFNGFRIGTQKEVNDTEDNLLYPGRRAWMHLTPETGLAAG